MVILLSVIPFTLAFSSRRVNGTRRFAMYRLARASRNPLIPLGFPAPSAFCISSVFMRRLNHRKQPRTPAVRAIGVRCRHVLDALENPISFHGGTLSAHS